MSKKLKKQTAKWKTKDGTVIRICDMDDNHLINTLKLLKKQAQKIYSEENNEKESYNDEWRSCISYNFYPMELEAKRREIDWEKEFNIQNSHKVNEDGLILDDWNGIKKKIRVTNKFKLIRFN